MKVAFASPEKGKKGVIYMHVIDLVGGGWGEYLLARLLSRL